MADKRTGVLIVDDEPVVCDVLYNALTERGYLCTRAFNARGALAKLETQDFEVVLLDVKLPEMSGLEVLSKIRSNHHNSCAIIITTVSNIDTAVEAMKLGASDYIIKPFDLDRVNTSIRTALETKQVTEKSPTEMDAIARGVEARLESLFGFSKIVTQETVDIARRFDIPQKEIQKWAAIRARHDAKRNAAIKSSLNKLERSPLAQSMMGIVVPYLCTPESDESQN